MPKKKVCVVTGTRAEYGLLKPVMEKIKNSNHLSLQVLVTGMHLLPEFGSTIEEIKKDGFTIDARVPIVVEGDNKFSMSISIGLGVISISQALEILSPKIVVVLGDRYEILAAAIATSYSGKVLAHLCGGDSPEGGYDEYSRHAITKMAHLHFPMTKKSSDRIIRMGENPENVHVVGYTSLDTILNKEFPDTGLVFRKFNLNPDDKLLVVVYHSISTNPEKASNEVETVLEAITEIGHQSLVIYPNVDPGGKGIIEAINHFAEKFPQIIKTSRSVPYKEYLSLLRGATVLIGNSSSGILEAPSFNLPVVNIGSRQEGRERSENIIDVNVDKIEIVSAVKTALFDKQFLSQVKNCKNPFGDGKASERIVHILEKTALTSDLIKKKFHDQE